jgi:hypothetical protein
VEQELKIKITVDPQTGKIKVLNSDFAQLANRSDEAAKSVNRLSDRIKAMGHASILGVLSYKTLAAPLAEAAREGVRYNATLEQTELALKATISGYIDAATGAERITKANALATIQMDKLRAASAETGVNFGEMTAAFKTFLPGALSVGMSMDGATKAAVRLTQAAKMQGIEFNALLAGIDGVARGTILVNSDFGRFLNALGLTNEALKEAADSGKTYELIMSKLADIPDVAATGAKGFNASFASLSATIDELRGALSKPIFDSITEGMQDFNKFLKDNKELIKSLPNALGDLVKSVAVFGAALYVLRGKAPLAVFAALKTALTSAGAAIASARASMAGLGGAYTAAGVRAGAFATAQRALGAAFRATPWGIVIAGLTAVATHFLTAKSAGEKLIETWDGAAESLAKFGKAELAVMERTEVQEIAKLQKQLSEMDATGGGVLGFGRKDGVERQAAVESLSRQIDERVESLKKIMTAIASAAEKIDEAGEIDLRKFNPDDAAQIVRELQGERDKLLLDDFAKLEKTREAMIEELVKKVAPDTDEFRQSVILIGEIYESELAKLNEKASKDRDGELKKIDAFIAKIGEGYAKATQSEVEQIKTDFAQTRQEAQRLLKGRKELTDVLKKIDDMEKIALDAAALSDRQKALDEAIRANEAVKEIEELAIDVAVLRGEITEEQANLKKQILGYDTEILNVERQIAALDPKADATRIAELEKTRDLLEAQKQLTKEEILPSPLLISIADSFAQAITDGFIKGMQEGSVDAADILGSIAQSVSGAFASNFSQQLSKGLAGMMAGGGMAGFDPVSMGASLAASYALSHVASVLTDEWKVTKEVDYLAQIVENTQKTYETFAVYAQMQKRFNDQTVSRDLNAPSLAITQAGRNATDITHRDLSPNDPKNYLFFADRVLGEVYAYMAEWASKTLGGSLGGVLSEIGYNLFGGHKYKTSGDDKSLQYINISAPDYTQRNIEEAQALVLGWFDDFWDNTTKFNLKIGETTKKKKGLFGSKKTTTEYFKQVTEAEAQMLAWLKQFGTTQYGDSLTAEGLKKLGEHLSAIYQIIDAGEIYAAKVAGKDMTEFAFQKAQKNLQEAQEIMSAYVRAANQYGAELKESYDDAASWLTEEAYAAIVGSLGAGASADELKQAMEMLQNALESAREATIAYYDAIYSRQQSEAEFIEWLKSAGDDLKSALDGANRSLYNVIEGLRSMANEARAQAGDLRGGDSDYYQRQYMQRLNSFNALFENGELRGDVTENQVREAWNLLSGASRSLADAMPDYRDDVKEALERSLLGIADMLDLSADILSVQIVGDAADLATNKTIGDLIKAIIDANKNATDGATLKWGDVGFDMGESALKKLGEISGVKTRAELDNLSSLLATLKTGDYASDRKVWESLVERAAQGDSEAIRLLETSKKALEYFGQSGEMKALEDYKRDKEARKKKEEEERKKKEEEEARKAAEEAKKQNISAAVAQLNDIQARKSYVRHNGDQHFLPSDIFYINDVKAAATSLISSLKLDNDSIEQVRQAFKPRWDEVKAYIIREYAMKGIKKTIESALPFAKGGIVEGASLFGFDRKLGLMGESGAEAIIPLPDGRSLPIDMRGGLYELDEKLKAIGATLERLEQIERSQLNFVAANDRRERRYMIEGYPTRELDAA